VGGSWSLKSTLNGVAGNIYGEAFTPDGSQLFVIDTSHTLNVYNIASGATDPTLTMSLGTATPFTIGISKVSPPDAPLVAIGYGDGHVDLMTFPAGAAPTTTSFTVSTAGALFGTQFSPDGTLLLAGTSDPIVGFWPIPLTQTKPLDPQLTVAQDGVNSLVFLPDGQHIAMAVGFLNLPSVGIWEVSTRNNTAITGVPLDNFPVSITMSPDGTALVAGEGDCGKVLVCAD
jgi:WD40 repeat protein